MKLQGLDLILLVAYVIALVGLSLSSVWKRNLGTRNEEKRKGNQTTEYLLGGRRLSLPAFVATLVSTWYGGILGIGEYGYQFGISQWLLFGIPFYVFTALFAVFLAGKIQGAPALSIPEAMQSTYGTTASRLSAVLISILVSPAPYILMIGLLAQHVFGFDGSMFWTSLAVAGFSFVYVSMTGFRAVVRTDMLQMILMYVGFGVILFMAWRTWGSPIDVWQAVPDGHRDLTGGLSFQMILVWFFIALWTFVDPSFHQRSAAAATPQIARRGMFVAIGFWAVFDLLTAFTGLYAFTILGPGLEEPILAFPLLADEVLGTGWIGLFYLACLATIMSTLDSLLFLSGQTLGRDFLAPVMDRKGRLSKGSPKHDIAWTRLGMGLSAILGVALLMWFPSVVNLWYVIGSVCVPGLLIPVLGLYIPFFSMNRPWVLASLIGGTTGSLTWLLLGVVADQSEGVSYLGLEPFYPGLAVALLVFMVGRRQIPRQVSR